MKATRSIVLVAAWALFACESGDGGLERATITRPPADARLLDATAAPSDTVTTPDTGPVAVDTHADSTDAASDSSDAGDTSTVTDTTPPGPLGTWERPIPIAELPFTDDRDTREAPTALFDRYGCALETDEGGDGFVYVVTVEHPGALDVRVDDVRGDAVDVDVHLLDAPDPDACLMRDNVGFTYPVSPGTYYVVVDTWMNGSGEALAGPYRLSVAFISGTEEESPYGTLHNPIIVESFPFVDTRDTRDAPGAALDGYSCAPDTDEAGGEFVYLLSVATAGELTVALDDVVGDGVDIDVHLLSGPDAGSCLARDNLGLSARVFPGTSYYVVADTWVNRDGDAQAGPYTVSMTFSPDVAPGDALGTVARPIIVDTFPFYDSRDTEAAPSDVFDSYSCEPGADESGGEFIYRIDVPEAGILQANVDDVYGDGIDIDLHLLSGPNPDLCLTRHNTNVSHAVGPGLTYLVADTWVNGSGKALAGSYTLEVNLISEPELDDFCIILYGDTRGRGASDAQHAHQSVIAAIKDRCADPILVHSGDHVRSGSSDSDWQRFIEIERVLYDVKGTLYPVRGNHDGSWANMRSRMASILSDSPESSRYVRELTPKLTLIALDSQMDADVQSAWLAQQLDAHPAADHRFVVAFHRPLYPSIGGHSGWSDGKTEWAPILRAHAGRVLVVTGHNHAISRELVDGVTYVTSGGGGAPLYGCTQAHAGTKYCANHYGYVVCDGKLSCVTFSVDAETGADTIADVFAL